MLPSNTGSLRYLEGPHPIPLAGQTFHVSVHSNRVGLRLTETTESHAMELTSEPACVGTIQRTPSGEIFIIGPDGPTIGGYPKIGYVVDADLDRLGQLKAGSPIEFIPVDGLTAIAIQDEQRQRLTRRLTELRLRALGTLD